MTVPHEDTDRKIREAHSSLDEVDAVMAVLRVKVDDLADALRAYQERQGR